MRDMPIRARLYIMAVVLAGMGCAIAGLMEVNDWLNVGSLLLLMVVLERIGFDVARVTHGSTYTLMTLPVASAAFVIEGPGAAALVGAAAVLVRGHGGTDAAAVVKRVFNAGNFAISAYLAGWTYVALGGPVASLSPGDFPLVLLPFTAANAVYCTANSALLAGVLALAQGARPGEVFRGYLIRSTPSYLGYGYFGLMIAVLWVGVGAGPVSAVLVLLPLLVARWAMGVYAREQEAYEATIRTLIQAVETKDEYTRGHSERVARGSVMIGRTLGVVGRRLEALRYAGILHDVGKLGVPTRILQKSGRLTDEEFEAIKEHPQRARNLLADLGFLAEARAGILHHHERLDGRGYPMGLRGDQIPEFARIIAVADAFDSMTSTRSYRGARTVADAVAELQRCAGTQFDPQMVAAMVSALSSEPWEARVDQPAPRPDGELIADHDDPQLLPVAEPPA
jgi:hypothetical protein